MEEYSWLQQNTVAQYIATLSLLDLCEESESAPGKRVWMPWWEKAVINLTRGREAAAAAAAKAEDDGVEEWQRGRKGRLPGWSTRK